MVQVVFCALEHLIGSSRGVATTIVKEKMRTRTDMKDFCEMSFKHKNFMVETFETFFFFENLLKL